MRSHSNVIALVLLAGCTAAETRRDTARTNDSAAGVDTVAVSARERVESANRACGARLITAAGIGDLKLGMTVDSVKATCHVAFDTIRPGPEGDRERVLGVSFPPDVVEAEIVQDSVWRLNVRAPGLMTRDSIAVGSPVSALLKHGQAQGVIGEGNFVVIYRDRCGISFELSGGIPPGRPHTWSADELRRLPATTRVQRILVYGCPAATHATARPSD